MNKRKILYFVIAILFGGFLFVYSEFDDSPGGQLLGLIIVVVGIIGVARSKKKATKSNIQN